MEFAEGGNTIKIYILEEYDSFCEYSSIVCAFTDKIKADKYKRTLERGVEESKRDVARCQECPIYLEEYNDKEKADKYKCDHKDYEMLDDGYFYCNGRSNLLYEIDRSYSIRETELR